MIREQAEHFVNQSRREFLARDDFRLNGYGGIHSKASSG
jgi:hypothetical protein